MTRSGKHVFFISSWYPGQSRSSGTFIETQIRALQELGLKCAIMFVSEFTAANFFRAKIKGFPLFDVRKNAGIQMVLNLVVHTFPLRFYRDVMSRRRRMIEQNAIKTFGEYIIANGRPDFIFHHGLFDYVYLTKAISAHFGIPYYFMEHSAFVEKGIIKTANDFNTISELYEFVRDAEQRFAVTRTYAKKFEDIFEASFQYCPNVLSSDFFLPPEHHTSHEHEGCFNFVNVGILEPHKNQELLLRAFAKSFAGQHDVKLKIAGDGRLGTILKEMSVALNVSDQVEILGFLRPEEIRTLLDRSQVFVLSSTFETFGVVLIEAMARGLPVISSDIDGPAELIDQGNGVLFENNSVDDLANKLVLMKDRYQEYDSTQIVQQTFERYGPEAFYKALFARE